MRKIDWLDFEINDKVYKRILIVGIVCIIGYLAITFLDFALPRRYHLGSEIIVDELGSVKNGVDHLSRGTFALQISGWAYKQGQAIESCDSRFILKNRETGKMYQLKTGVKQVPELQFVDGFNCLKCGLVSRSMIIGLKKGKYDLYILYQNDKENLLVNTNTEVGI